MKNYYDVIIIGGGIGGLTVGNYLAQSGFATVILEKNAKVGGYMSSFQRRGYTFEGGLTSFGSSGIVFPILEELELRDKIEFVPTKRQIITEDFNVRIDGSLIELFQSLAEVYPEERKQLQAYFKWIEMVCRGFDSLFELPIFVGNWYQAIPGVMKMFLRNPSFLKFLLQGQHSTNRDLHERFFRDSRLKKLLNRLGYPVMSVLVTGGMWYSLKTDYWYPLGGMQVFSDLLAQKFQQLGGEICLNSEVTKINLKDDRVRGVTLADGKSLTGKIVISNIDLHKTYLDLLDSNASKNLLSKMQKAYPSESMFSVFLGLRGKGFASAAYPINSSHCLFQIGYAKMGKNVFGDAEFSVNIPSLEDPSLAPGESVIISCFDEYADWVDVRNNLQLYQERKAIKIGEVLALAKRIFPDLEERLVVVEGATPLTYHNYTGSFNGATAGWSWNPEQQPKINWVKEGKIPGLYLVGQWLFNPGGVPSSMLTARQTGLAVSSELKSH